MSIKNFKYRAFTLAEILITLAIIGVVAALTIRSVVVQYQKQVYYTKFMKTYNTLSNALTIAMVKNGPPDTWGFDNQTYDTNHQILLNNLIPYLKVSKICKPRSSCDMISGLDIYNLDGSRKDSYTSFGSFYYWSKFLLDDGALVLLYGSSMSSNAPIYVSLDINGPQKGPNTWGRDIFDYLTFTKIGQKYQLMPPGMSNGKNPFVGEKCKNGGDDARYCAARLLTKHKMDY